MPEPTSDPSAPLPGAPEPWAATDTPSPRPGPPFHMTDMIAAESALARRLLGRLADPAGPVGDAARALASAISETLAAGAPIVVTGCGTSEHGALGLVELVRDGLRSGGRAADPTVAVAAQAFELALDPPSRGLVVGISHEGATWATNRALSAATTAGARVAIVTVSGRSPGAALADPALVVETGELDQSWCHTVGYLSPLLAGHAIAADLAGRPLGWPAIEAAAALVAAGTSATATAGAERVAAALGDVTRLVVVASGADRVAGRELVLKLEEGTWIPSAYRDLETILHGHWPGTDGSTGLVLVQADRRARRERLDRAIQALEAARVIGVRSAAILAAEVASAIPESLTPAGRIVVPEAPDLGPAAAALLGTATPLQLLTERLARVRGTDPDAIRRGQPAYRDAAAAAEG